MNILSIKAKSKNTNIFEVKTESEIVFLHSDAIVKFFIKVGEVDAQNFNYAKEESELIIATNKALSYINKHIKTEKQVKDYLYKQNYKAPVVNKVLNKLKDYNLLNDGVYAQSYINSNPSFSKRKLMQKLQSFGVKKEAFETCLTEIDEEASCKKEVEKFFKTKQPSKENVEKLTRRLLTKGYGWETIKSCLNNLLEEDYN